MERNIDLLIPCGHVTSLSYQNAQAEKYVPVIIALLPVLAGERSNADAQD